MSEDTYGDDEYDEDDVLALMSTGHFCLQCTMSTMYNVYNVQCLQGIIVYNVQCTMYNVHIVYWTEFSIVAMFFAQFCIFWSFCFLANNESESSSLLKPKAPAPSKLVELKELNIFVWCCFLFCPMRYSASHIYPNNKLVRGRR